MLRQAGHDVALAREQHLVGVSDDRLLTVAVSEGRVLISFDRVSTTPTVCDDGTTEEVTSQVCPEFWAGVISSVIRFGTPVHSCELRDRKRPSTDWSHSF